MYQPVQNDYPKKRYLPTLYFQACAPPDNSMKIKIFYGLILDYSGFKATNLGTHKKWEKESDLLFYGNGKSSIHSGHILVS